MKFRALDIDYDAEAVPVQQFESFVVEQVYEKDRLLLAAAAPVPNKPTKRKHRHDGPGIPDSRKVSRISPKEALKMENSHRLIQDTKQRNSPRTRDPILSMVPLTHEVIENIIASIRMQTTTPRLANIPWHDHQTIVIRSRALDASFKLYRFAFQCQDIERIARQQHWKTILVHSVKEEIVENALVTPIPSNALVPYRPPPHVQCLSQAVQVAYLLCKGMQANLLPSGSKNKVSFCFKDNRIEESIQDVDSAAVDDASPEIVKDAKDEPWPECNDSFVFSPIKAVSEKPCAHDQQKSNTDEAKAQRKKSRKEKKEKRRREKKENRRSSKKQKIETREGAPNSLGHSTDKQRGATDMPSEQQLFLNRSRSGETKKQARQKTTARPRWIEGPCLADTPQTDRGKIQQNSLHHVAKRHTREAYRKDSPQARESATWSSRLGWRDSSCLGKRRFNDSISPNGDQQCDTLDMESRKRQRDNVPSVRPISTSQEEVDVAEKGLDNSSKTNKGDNNPLRRGTELPKVLPRRATLTAKATDKCSYHHSDKDAAPLPTKIPQKHQPTSLSFLDDKQAGSGADNLQHVHDRPAKPLQQIQRTHDKSLKDLHFEGNRRASKVPSRRDVAPNGNTKCLSRNKLRPSRGAVEPGAPLFNAFRQNLGGKIDTSKSNEQTDRKIFERPGRSHHLKQAEDVANGAETIDTEAISQDNQAEYYKWSVPQHDNAMGSGIPQRSDENVLTGEPQQNPQFVSKAANTSESASNVAVRCLCSEAFLETNSAIVSELATGTWSGHTSRNRSIDLEDTSLLDLCKVDIETPDRRGILVLSASQMNSPDGVKETVYYLVKLAASCRYQQITVFVSLDSADSDLFPVYLAKVHCAMSSQIEPTGTSKIAVVPLPPDKVSAGIANLALLTRKPAPDQAMLDHQAIELVALPNVLAIERAKFFLDLLPSLSAYGALQCLILAERMSPQQSQGFLALFTSKILRQRLIIQTTSKQIGIAINPSAIAHLSKLLETVLS